MSTNPFDREVRRKLKNYESPVSPDLLEKVLVRRQRRVAPFHSWGFRALFFGLLIFGGLAVWYGLLPNESREEVPVPKQKKSELRQPLAFFENQQEADLPEAVESVVEQNVFDREEKTVFSENSQTKAIAPKGNEHLKQARREQGTRSDVSSSGVVAEQILAPDAGKEKSVWLGHQEGEKIPTEMAAEQRSASSDELTEGEAESIFLPTALLWKLPKEAKLGPRKFPLVPGPRCADFEQGVWQFFFDFTFSPDFALRSIRPKDEQSVPLALKRLETESAKQSYSLGTTFSLVSPGGMSFRTGFAYAQINERFAYQGDTEERIIISIIYDDQGQIIGTDTSYESYTPYYASSNVYRLFDIPVLFGYQLDLKKFALTFQGGTYINLFLAPEGTFFSPELQPVSFDEIPAFRKRASLSLAVAFGVNYRLNPRMSLVFEPKFRYFFSPITTKDYLLEQQYMVVGLNLGAKLRL